MYLRYRSYCKQLQMKSIVNSRFFFKFRSVIKYCAIMITHVFASINRGNSTALTTSNSLRKDSKYTDNWFIYILYIKNIVYFSLIKLFIHVIRKITGRVLHRGNSRNWRFDPNNLRRIGLRWSNLPMSTIYYLCKINCFFPFRLFYFDDINIINNNYDIYK